MSQLAAVLVTLVVATIPALAAAHGPGERLHPEERARLRHELRMRAVDAGAEQPPTWHRLSPEERRELRLAIRDERRARRLHGAGGEPGP
jgi:hypothetical protein